MSERPEPEHSDGRAGFVDFPDGPDFHCDECGRVWRVLPDTPGEDFDHDCGAISRVVRAYFWDGNRTDVVIEYVDVTTEAP
jgi:hypothetical protein